MFGILGSIASIGVGSVKNNAKMYIYGGIAIVITLLGVYIYTLFTAQQLEISSLKNKIVKLGSVVNTKNLEILNRDGVIKQLDNSVANMLYDINVSNTIIETKEKELTVAKGKLDTWLAKPAVVKYEKVYKYIDNNTTDYSKDSCANGLKLNRSISELNYDDL